ncbi:hypothetical protein [Aquimarina agarivorans]|uniref:hypothetical protein n=1 Tax=Aquimarina agarivorans TaxID=980584 RepID=UPI000248E7CA|nr:hypothetical protein [Aquimarina agarivorans]
MKYLLSLLSIAILLNSCKNTEKNTPKNSTTATEQKVETTPPEITPEVVEQIKDDETISAPPVVDHFICYKNNENPKMIIWISFTEKHTAIEVKYKGQKATIPLTFEKEEYVEGGTHPTIHKFYKEIYDGKENGSYKLTHSGNYDYAEYTRGKDGKKFKFTIDHNANPYGKEPCF